MSTSVWGGELRRVSRVRQLPLNGFFVPSRVHPDLGCLTCHVSGARGSCREDGKIDPDSCLSFHPPSTVDSDDRV